MSEHSYKKSTIIGVGADLPKTEKSAHYVDNAKLYEAMVERKRLVAEAIAAGKPIPKVSEFIGACIWKIADNLSQKYQFRHYPFREDMVGDAVLHMITKVDNFNTDYGKNPFSYFTQTAYYQFLPTILAEKKGLAVKYKLTLERIATQEVSEHDDDYHQLVAEENLPDTSIMSDYIKKYEASIKAKKPDREIENKLEEFLE